MRFLNLESLILHAKAEGDDNELLALYGDAAEQGAEISVNRTIFKDAAARDAAHATIEARLAAARAEIEVAETDVSRNLAQIRYQSVVDACHRDSVGIIVDAHLMAAMLAVATTSYMIRSTVVAGSGAAAVAVPDTALAVYQMRRYMGEVAYG